MRTAFVWDVQLGGPGGVVNYEFTAFWSPERVSADEIAQVAAIQYRLENDVQLMPISAKLRDSSDQ